MSKSITGILSNLSAHFKYFAATTLVEDGPPEKVRTALEKQGWSFVTVQRSEEEIRNIIMAHSMAHGYCGPAAIVKIFSPEGAEVFTEQKNKPLEAFYKDTVRRTAAQVYGLKI